jgi:hypothetical protein
MKPNSQMTPANRSSPKIMVPPPRVNLFVLLVQLDRCEL